MIEQIFWIGVEHSSVHTGWSWTDGSPFAYLGWIAGESCLYLSDTKPIITNL